VKAGAAFAASTIFVVAILVCIGIWLVDGTEGAALVEKSSETWALGCSDPDGSNRSTYFFEEFPVIEKETWNFVVVAYVYKSPNRAGTSSVPPRRTVRFPADVHDSQVCVMSVIPKGASNVVDSTP